MLLQDLPIQKKLMRIIILICGVVLLLACTSFFIYEYYSFRQNTIQKLATISNIISTNSTAALAFENRDDAAEILSALKAEPNIVSACLYDKRNTIFSTYPPNDGITSFPGTLKADGYYFGNSYIEQFESIYQEDTQLGTLYLKSDFGAMNERLKIYSIVSAIIITLSLLLSIILSKIFQKTISLPIVALAETARVISEQNDYSIRAVKSGQDELGMLTDAFNKMLIQIQQQNQTLNEFNKSLEQKVTERTLELKRSNEDLEQFAYVASHDLQEPLRTVTSYVQLIARRYKDKLDQDGNDFINFAVDGSNRMRTLIQSLLEYSRVNSKRPFENINTNSLFDSLLHTLNESIKENKVVIKSDPLPDIFGDPILINQLFQNLLSNAIKFKNEGGNPEIHVTGKKTNGEYLFSVKDNGIGIPKEYANKIFIIFQRLHEAEKFPGTGIGLAICKKIVERHGGKIWFESEPGHGTTFFFTIKAK